MSFWYSRSMEGISARQGGHQVAQKFRNTSFPRYWDRETFLPLKSDRVKSMDAVPSLSAASPIALNSSAVTSLGGESRGSREQRQEQQAD